VGVVEETGGKVTAWAPGDRVGVPWLNRTCGVCRFCKSGRENLCESGTFTGYHVDGGFAEYTVQYADWIYKVPIKTQVREFDLKDANQALILLKQSKIKGAGVLRI